MTEEDAKSALRAHLQRSSLHNGLNKDNLELQVEMVDITEWQEDNREWNDWADTHGTGSDQHNDQAWGKRKRNEDAPVIRAIRPASKRAPNRNQLRDIFPGSGPPMLHLCRGSGVTPCLSGGQFVPSGVPMGHSVTLSAMQAQTVMDSLSRGRLAMELVLRVINSAQAAFENEMQNVADMQDVLQSWLSGAAARDSTEFQVAG